MNKKNKINIALFGAGRIGQVHAMNALYHPRINIKYIVDPYLEGAQRLASEVGAMVSGTETVMNDQGVKGIIIASATDTHAELIKKCVHKQKAIFCEKPISLDIDTAKSCVNYINETNTPCMMGFQRRYDKNFRQLHERIRSGEVGQVEQVFICSRDPGAPPIDYIKRSGGIFRDMVSHDFDMVRYLVDEPIATVYAVASCLVDPEIAEAGDNDTLSVLMTTASGAQIQIANTRRGPLGYEQRVEVVCSKSVLKVTDVQQHSMVEANAAGYLSAPPENFFLERYAQAYRDELTMFVDIITDQVKPLADHNDGYAAQCLSEAAIESLNKGMPIKFN